MRITYKAAKCGYGQAGYIVNDGSVTMDVESLTIDGRPYHPPEPKRQRWECEVALGPDVTYPDRAYAVLGRKSDNRYDWEVARAKLAFWSTGEVAFADQRAKWLASMCMDASQCTVLTDTERAALREAALRLAGPE